MENIKHQVQMLQIYIEQIKQNPDLRTKVLMMNTQTYESPILHMLPTATIDGKMPFQSFNIQHIMLHKYIVI